MNAQAAGRERPLDYFLGAIKQAERGENPVWRMKECLTQTHLTTPGRDGWTLLERLEGRSIESNREYLSRDLVFLWQARNLKNFEKKVLERKSSKAEDEVAKLMIGMVLVHKLKGEDLCVYGTAKLTNATRQRPELVLEALGELQETTKGFISPAAIDTRRGIVMQTTASQVHPHSS